MQYDFVPLPERQPLKWPNGARPPVSNSFLAYAKSFDGVWWATREEMATWYLENHASHIG